MMEKEDVAALVKKEVDAAVEQARATFATTKPWRVARWAEIKAAPQAAAVMFVVGAAAGHFGAPLLLKFVGF